MDLAFVLQIIVLAIVQGLAELLPVSSSAHVVVAEKLMHIDPSSPPATLLLVMLHTGTMFAVILYFWKSWQRAFFSSKEKFNHFLRIVVIASVCTVVLGFGLKKVIEHAMVHADAAHKDAEIEQLFGRLDLIAPALAAVGVLILLSGLRRGEEEREDINDMDAAVIGLTQGLCLPFRGFSRSGATISAGLLRGLARVRLEEYSFALAVVITPGIIGMEALRLVKHHDVAAPPLGVNDFLPALLGMVFSFIAGLVALKLLSRLLERGKWWMFGIYCLAAAAVVFSLHLRGF